MQAVSVTMRRKIKVVLFGVLNVFIVSTMVGTVYAQTSNPEHVHCIPSRGCTDLKIRDQDETWSDGVSETWTVENMVPGSVYELDGSFVGRGTMDFLKSSPVDWVNFHSPGLKDLSPPLILIPLPKNPD